VSAIALGLAVVFTVVAAALRFGGASLLRTHRADALRDAAEGRRGAQAVAALLEEPVSLQPSLGMVHAALLVGAAIPAAWALSAMASGWVLAILLVALGIALVLVGDTLPRSFGRATPRGPAYRLARLLVAAITLGRRASDFIYDEDDDDEAGDEDELVDDSEEIELISSPTRRSTSSSSAGGHASRSRATTSTTSSESCTPGTCSHCSIPARAPGR